MNPPIFSLLSLHRLTFEVPGLAKELVSQYGSAAAVLDHFDARLTPLTPALVRKLTVDGFGSEHAAKVESDLKWIDDDPDCWMRVHGSENYPSSLDNLTDPPFVLFGTGNPDVLEAPQIAVVGSRKASANGVTSADAFAGELAACGFTITSGLAMGIDAAAHRGALRVGGQSIAVQAIGAGDVYPRRHVRLAAQIVESGCVITEYPPGVAAMARHFPNRNRIVTGLSLGTLVVEARLASGSLISARLASEQGREVFAVPGSVLAKYNDGCHQLIRQGAKLAANLADILEEFPDFEVKRHRRVRALSGQEQKVLGILEISPCHADKLYEQTGIPIPELMALLISLEIQAEIESGPLGYRIAGGNLESP